MSDQDEADGAIPTGPTWARRAAPSSRVYAEKISKRADRIGFGCLIQGIGVLGFILGAALLLTLTDFAILLGLLLMACGITIAITGGIMARRKRYHCERCGNPQTKEAKICPTCSATFLR